MAQRFSFFTRSAATANPSAQQREEGEHSVVPGLGFAFFSALAAEIVYSDFLSAANSSVFLGRLLSVFLCIYTLHRFLLSCIRSYRPSVKDLSTTTLVIIGSIVLVWVGELVGESLVNQLGGKGSLAETSRGAVAFALPFAAGGLLLQSVLGLHYGLLYSGVFSLLMVVYGPRDPLLIPYIATTSLVGCLSLTRIRSRSAYLHAGLHITLIGIPFALGSAFLSAETTALDLGVRIGGACLGGVLCYFIAIGFTPFIEHLGGYVTDIRLLEMATLDHPLLKDLSVQAPGTWNHSMVMGMMVEAAADVVGANPVLARVAAYFHDIGKIKKPLYFVENQAGQENRHDKLSSSMSALIIRSHVKDGLELARKHKLPRAIEDMIPQHHGTSLIEFFYNKAVKEASEAAGEPVEVDPSLYTYPGPKPQTKEAGILMLADGIEAAARTLTEPTHDRIQGLVQKMINKVFRSGQLNECDLTLQDLHMIAACFTRILTAIYHQRVAYAEPAEKVAEKAKVLPAPTDAADGEPRKPSEPVASTDTDKKTPALPDKEERATDSGDDLKRLGM